MGKFWKGVSASCLGTLIGLTLFLSLAGGGLSFLLASLLFRDTSTKVSPRSILVFDLSTSISDTEPASTLGQALTEGNSNTLTLRQVLQAIDIATRDNNITALLLYGRGAAGDYGYATLEEVRQGLKKFKAAGKKIIAYDTGFSEKEYYLASMADEVVLNSMGQLEFNGLSSQQTFFAGAMEKYGVGAQVVRVGSYKSAVEPYIRKNLSPENKQQLGALLGDVWTNYLTVISENRHIPVQKLRQISNREGILSPEVAQKAGLVDKVGYLDQVIDKMRTITGETANEIDEDKPSFRQVSLGDYTGVKPAKENTSTNKVAIVYAEGTIVDGQGTSNEVGGDRYARIFRKLRENKDVKAVVLRINSPGGSATASEVMGREITLLNQQKPVIVSMGDVAASGGYWITTGAKKVYAQNTTITGSIGVFGLLFNIEKIGNDNGVTWDTVKTATFADINTSTRPKTPAELDIYQRSVNRVYSLFLDKVAKGRDLPLDKVKNIAQGRVWSGQSALSIGLVDEIGGLEKAIGFAVETAKLGKDWTLEEYPTKKTFEQEIIGRLLNTQMAKSSDPLNSQWQKFQKELQSIKSLNDPNGVYTRLPFNWEIR
ncbi:MAG: Protease 4 [Chroococcopsis gigantea SAG 12.99]|jgi:protease-4|nr:signal peptide peptidase SppA [Chlorogloea purpurea SAG 13.99]MDV3001788.1 Protease 4 [Chroococcopsis gigantea SAG 12.99]